ncbi:hypothetical protein NMY22_g8614 [Coprinellus aureogranulatus]|nr:hypothetical protein NMY22_g8614 [Coprinellus aureogranulatus]
MCQNQSFILFAAHAARSQLIVGVRGLEDKLVHYSAGVLGWFRFRAQCPPIELCSAAILHPTSPLMASSCLIPSNPDVSGVGVRTSIYSQNVLCFIPALYALYDGKVDDEELESAEIHTTTNLVLAFAILFTCIFQALARELSNYHSSIVLTLSWMNNTNAFVYFILYVQSKSQGRGGIEPKLSKWKAHLEGRVRTILCLADGDESEDTRIPSRKYWSVALNGTAVALLRRIPLLLGSIHFTLMAALGIWLWSSPQTFGTSTTASCVTQAVDLLILGIRARFGSPGLRIVSLVFYTLFLVPGINLLIPVVLFLWLHCSYHTHRLKREPQLPLNDLQVAAVPRSPQTQLTRTGLSPNPQTLPPTKKFLISLRRVLPAYLGLAFLLVVNILFIVDIELTIRRNRRFQGAEESEWGFGQILAILLLAMPLRDVVEAVFRRRHRLQSKLNNALREAINDRNWEGITTWVAAKADPNVKTDNGETALGAATKAHKWPLISALIEAKADLKTMVPDEATVLEEAASANEWQVIQDLIHAGVDIAVLSRHGSIGSVLEMASLAQNWPVVGRLVEVIADRDVDLEFTGALSLFSYPLWEANEWQLVHIFIQKQVNVSRRFHGGLTALEVAVSAPNWLVARALVKANANVNTIMADGTTPLEKATLAIQWPLVQDMIQAGADLTKHFKGVLSGPTNVWCMTNSYAILDDDTKTLLHAVCRHKRNELLKLLLEKGADCTVVNAGHQTAFDFAVEAKNTPGAITVARKVLELEAQDDPARPRSLANLANALVMDGSPFAVREAVRLLRQALALLPPDHADIPNLSRDLINALQQTTLWVFNRDQLISVRREALQLSPAGSSSRLSSLDELATALLRKGTPASIQESYPLIREALSLRPSNDDTRLLSLQGLDGSLRGLVDTVRTKQSAGRLQELEEAIPLLREALDILPAAHSSHGGVLQSLAIALEESGSIDSMHEAILLQRRVLQLCPSGHPDRAFALNAIAYSLAQRYDAVGNLADLEESIVHAREAIICGRCATSTIEYLDESLDLIRQAIPLWPSRNPEPFDISRVLAPIFFFYYEKTGATEQLEEAATWCERALALCSPNHCCRHKLVALKSKIDLALTVTRSKSVPPQ